MKMIYVWYNSVLIYMEKDRRLHKAFCSVEVKKLKFSWLHIFKYIKLEFKAIIDWRKFYIESIK